MLSENMLKGALFASAADRMVWAVFLLIYLAAMVVAMYPGRNPLGPPTRGIPLIRPTARD